MIQSREPFIQVVLPPIIPSQCYDPMLMHDEVPNFLHCQHDRYPLKLKVDTMKSGNKYLFLVVALIENLH